MLVHRYPVHSHARIRTGSHRLISTHDNWCPALDPRPGLCACNPTFKIVRIGKRGGRH
jgi:hypothetical protein